MSKLNEILVVNDKLKKTVKELYKKTDADIKEDVEILREWLKKQPHLPQEMDELKNNVKKMYEKSDEEIKMDVAILREWLRKQPHLPQTADDDELEKVLMRNKFRIEQSKKKLDAYYSLRGLYSEFFDPLNIDPKSKAILNSQKTSYFFPLPTPLENGERILIYKIRDPSTDIFNMQHQFSLYFAMLEVINKNDYCVSVRCVCDLSGFKFAHYTKLDPIVVIKGMKLWQEGFSSRFAGIEYLNAPSFMDLMVKLVQQVIKESKLRVHTTIDTLYDVVPKDKLPNDLGGKAGTLEELQESWIKEVEVQKDFIAHRAKQVSNEKLRIGPMLYNDMFGTEGSFKKLNLD